MNETTFAKTNRLERENKFLNNQAVRLAWSLEKCKKELQQVKRQRDLAESALSCYRIQGIK